MQGLPSTRGMSRPLLGQESLMFMCLNAFTTCLYRNHCGCVTRRLQYGVLLSDTAGSRLHNWAHSPWFIPHVHVATATSFA